jgi:hypothetical protein
MQNVKKKMDMNINGNYLEEELVRGGKEKVQSRGENDQSIIEGKYGNVIRKSIILYI